MNQRSRALPEEELQQILGILNNDLGADEPGSVVLVGAGGNGKSVVLRRMLAQLASAFPRSCYLIGPHFTSLLADEAGGGSIRPFLGGVAQTGEEIAALLEWVGRELQERRRREMTGDTSWRGQGIYLVLDELAEVVRREPSAEDSLVAFLQSGRAFGISVILFAH
jgi:DNA segregation ATPase FtsK/SpoIIIE-like protein